MADQYRFAAFISYSSKDAAFAKRLHAALESYGIPNTLGKFDLEVERGKRNRIYPVFRDREELSAGDLGDRIKAALEQSRSLIVVCSPNAAASPWVQKEIETFLALGRREHVFAIIAPNAPLVDDKGADATHLSFPPAFRGSDLADQNALEPIAADARAVKDGFRNAWLKLVAGMIGVNAGALQDRDRRSRQMRFLQNAAVVTVATLAVATAWTTQDRWQPPINDYVHYSRYAVAKGSLPPLMKDGSFQDCQQGSAYCPQMVIIPKGQFWMGSPETEADRKPDEGPRHVVTVERFAASKYDITFADWNACVAGGGCKDHNAPDRFGWKGDDRPVINVSWKDAHSYVSWLSQETGQTYRLLTEAEWEYAARGSTTLNAPSNIYPWGNELGSAVANCWSCGSKWDKKQTSPVGSFKPNAFGLYDMAGNVDQWVEDCYRATYDGAPSVGFPSWSMQQCSQYVVRGGAYASYPDRLRVAARISYNTPDARNNGMGFRVARRLSPS